MMGAEVGQN